MPKVMTITNVFKGLLPKVDKSFTAIKPQSVSIFQEAPQNVRYIHNVLTYPPKRQITPEEVKELFVDDEIYGGYFREQMLGIKKRHFFDSIRKSIYNKNTNKIFDFSNFKLWLHSVNISKKLSKQDLVDIADFMNMHDGKYMRIWKDCSGSDFTPNVDKLALFVRSIKRIKLLDYYKNLDSKSWENCIDGIINRPNEVVPALMQYKYNSDPLNLAITYGTQSIRIKQQIREIKKFLDKQFLKNEMIVYRGEKSFGAFDSVKLGNGQSLKDVLEEFTSKAEKNILFDSDIKLLLDKYLTNQYIPQSRFMSTAIEPSAVENYAKKVFWKIKVPAKTKASFIEGYNVERESEAELLIQMGSKLLIKDVKYD
ncbi:hypothetical protein IJD34_07810, partial [bacterium]|nr:hypothetical protein [bacterium]